MTSWISKKDTSRGIGIELISNMTMKMHKTQTSKNTQIIHPCKDYDYTMK